MGKVLASLVITLSVALLACGGASDEATGDNGKGSVTRKDAAVGLRGAGFTTATSAPAATAAPAAPGAFARGGPQEVEGGRPDAIGAAVLETAQRKIISTASVSIEVEVVEEAITQVRGIAGSVGGFVEHLSSSGGAERRRATITIRVPQAQFSLALEQIEKLGDLQSRNLGAEDVSEQFIDLEARLKSSLREEQSLLSLLDRIKTVGDILAIERELSRVRSEIERFQGQLNFLERRVDLATISVSLASPEVEAGEPPSANLGIKVSDVSGSVAQTKSFIASLEGVVDRVFLSQRDGREEAGMSLRVLDSRFNQAVDFLEGQGKVRNKEILEGKPPPDGSTGPNRKPRARIDVSLVEDSGWVNPGLIAAIAGPIGGVALAGVFGLLIYWSYRAGRRRGTGP